MELRDYQADCLAAVVRGWLATPGEPLVVKLPTGSGKTVVFAALVEQMTRGNHRALILVNRDELVKQTCDKLRRAGVNPGTVQGDSDQWREKVVVASVQTISRSNRLARIPQGRYQVVIADEMQYSAAESWQRTLKHFAAPMVVGFSATPERGDRKGLGDYWSRVVFERDTSWAIEHGHLVEPTCVRSVLVDLDLSRVKKSGGDFQDAALGAAMTSAHAAESVAASYADVARAEDGSLRRGIVFAPTVAVAQEFAASFNAAGIVTETIFGHTPIHERQAAYARVVEGRTRVLASVMVLAVGFDLPCVEVAVMARPTKSRSLYVQQAGRVLRPSPATGKTSALILDVTGVSALGLASFADLGTTKPTEPNPFAELPQRETMPRELQEIVTINGAIDLRPVDPITGRLFGSVDGRGRRERRATFKALADGTMYLRPNSSYQWVLYVTLDDTEATAWGAPPGRGKPLPMFRGSLLDVVRDLQLTHPGDPPPLEGVITDKQLAWLGFAWRDATKQDASDEITRRMVAKRLGKR